MDCLECKKYLVQTPGKRARQFCNSTCRSNFWQKQERKKKPKQQPSARKKTEPPKQDKSELPPEFKSNFEKIMWEAKQHVTSKK